MPKLMSKKSWKMKILKLVITFIESKGSPLTEGKTFVLFVTNVVPIRKIQFLMMN